MPDESHPVTSTSNLDLLVVLDRIEAKQDTRFANLDSKVDRVSLRLDEKVDRVVSRLDRMEGAIGMFKWLGPTGVAAVIYALLKGAGYL